MKKTKLLLLLVLLMTAATGARAQSGTPSVKKLTVPDTWTGDMTTFSAADLPSDFAAVGDDIVTTIPAPTATGNAVLIYGFSGGETKYVEYANGVQSATDSRDFPRDQIYGYVNIMGYEGVYYTAAATTYTVSLKDGVKDADKWTISPNPAPEGSPVTIQYNGRLKVKGVKATSDAAPAEATPALSISNPSVGQVIGSDGKNYAAASVPSGVTKVAMIAYVSGSNGLAIALADEGKLNWATAKSTCEAKKPAFTGGTWKLPSQAEWNQMFKANGGDEERCYGLNTKINTAGGTALLEGGTGYWTSTSNGSNVWYVWLMDGDTDWRSGNVNLAKQVRACLAFTVEQAKPAATVTTAPTGAAIVGVGKATELVSGGVADGGTLMYAVTTTNTKPTSTAGFSDAVPTAKDITASGKVYVWYYVKGDDTHSDSEIAATAIEVPVADIVWDATNISDILVDGSGASYDMEGVTLSANGENVFAWWNDYGDPTMDGIEFYAEKSGGYTFTAPDGKAFTKIEMKALGPDGWDSADLGTGWAYNNKTVTWKGTAAASTVDLLTDDIFYGAPITSIVFYLSE